MKVFVDVFSLIQSMVLSYTPLPPPPSPSREKKKCGWVWLENFIRVGETVYG
jgi:hypothetical protein